MQAVQKESGMLNLGKGDIVVDSAADESCWPAGQPRPTSADPPWTSTPAACSGPPNGRRRPMGGAG